MLWYNYPPIATCTTCIRKVATVFTSPRHPARPTPQHTPPIQRSAPPATHRLGEPSSSTCGRLARREVEYSHVLMLALGQRRTHTVCVYVCLAEIALTPLLGQLGCRSPLPRSFFFPCSHSRCSRSDLRAPICLKVSTGHCSRCRLLALSIVFPDDVRDADN